MKRIIVALATSVVLGIPSLASAQETLEYAREEFTEWCPSNSTLIVEQGFVVFSDGFVTFIPTEGTGMGIFNTPLTIPTVTSDPSDLSPTKTTVIGGADLVDFFGNNQRVAVRITVRRNDRGKAKRAKGLIITYDDENECIGEMRFVAKLPES